MVAPVVLVTPLLIGYPLARGVYLSLTDATEANVGPHHRRQRTSRRPTSSSGCDNYLDDPDRAACFWDELIWTVIWTVGCVALHYGLGLGLAMLLNRQDRGSARSTGCC